MDARSRRSREKLGEAILRLASQQELADITVAELARAAGVHRSTVYEHAESPAALLRAVLRDELDEVRRERLGDVTPETLAVATRCSTIDVLEHIQRHAAVYARELGSDDESALHTMLSSHFRGSLELLIADRAIPLPEGFDEPSMFARFIADGTVGAIDSWLRQPEPRDMERFLVLYRQLLPAWWPVG